MIVVLRLMQVQLRSSVYFGRLSSLGLLGVLLGGLLAGCVTETKHSVYTKEFSTDVAVQARVDAAMEYLRKNDTDNAVRHLRIAHELDSRSAVVNNGLALTFQVSGEKALAEKHYKAALRADRSLTSARNNYAVFLYSEERYPEACRQMRQVIKDTLYVGRSDAFHNLGQCEMRLGNMEEAQEYFVRALALNRNHTGTMLELAEINLSLGNYVQAQRYFEAFDSRAEQNPRSLFMGIQLAEQFGQNDAQASYALALKNLYPHSVEYLRYKKESGNNAANRATQ
jgi:type IV pilus assembly protein PilF